MVKNRISREVSKYLARIGQHGGKKGGRSTSEAKKRAARANGKKGRKSLKLYYRNGRKHEVAVPEEKP